ncbi:hypothetical protein CC79DRAFT_1363024 [Sarocladium strictum]
MALIDLFIPDNLMRVIGVDAQTGTGDQLQYNRFLPLLTMTDLRDLMIGQGPEVIHVWHCPLVHDEIFEGGNVVLELLYGFQSASSSSVRITLILPRTNCVWSEWPAVPTWPEMEPFHAELYFGPSPQEELERADRKQYNPARALELPKCLADEGAIPDI